MAYSMTDLKKHLNIELDGIPYKITEYQHVKPGKGAAFVRTKIKSLLDGKVIEKTFHAGDKAEEPNLGRKDVTYSYNDDDYFYFMDENYEMIPLTYEQVDEAQKYILDGMSCTISFHNDKPIAVDLPESVEYTIEETTPSTKGDRQGACRKPAKINTGATITIPCHINEGDKVIVNTSTGEYSGKA